MKQLLHSCGSSVIAALNDHAYAVLSPPPRGSKSVVYELLPPRTEKHNNNGHDGEEGNNSSADRVEAVAVTPTQNGDAVLCAVSRNKDTSLYSIPIETEADDTKQVRIATPYATHRTGKRACGLAFARIPIGQKGGSNESSSEIDIIIAADLAGDATAFPARVQNAARNEDDDAESTNTTSVSRVLLGHTASMLTGLKVVADEGGLMRILTSDRDEKVRVSAFPKTYLVEGYLLGHKAFISSLDVATNVGCSRCVTCSGDGTVKLWDYQSCKELSSLGFVSTMPSSNDANAQSAGDCAEPGRANESSSTEASTEPIPIDVAISPDGKTIASIRDRKDTMDVHHVQGSDRVSLEPSQTITIGSQPLAVKFLANDTIVALTTEPSFLLQYQREPDSSTFSCVTKSSPACLALKAAGGSAGIVMPSTVLETDETGQVKMMKLKDNPGFVSHKPWNDAERIKKAKNRAQRRRKRSGRPKRPRLERPSI